MTDNPKQPGDEGTDTQPPDDAVGVVEPVLSSEGELTIPTVQTSAGAAAGSQPAQLGAGRYVHAAFFAFAALSGYLAARLCTSLWNWLAEWPLAVQHVPQLLRLSEDERDSVGSVVGVLIGLLTLVYFYRKPAIRSWAEEVASELTKVTWPDRETVTNGTVIVIVASLIATVYVTLLDRLWGFATRLISGS